MPTKKPEKRGRRRTTIFTGGPVSVRFTAEMLQDIEREADRDNLATAEVVRRAVAVGLPRLKDTARKRRRREAGQ